MSKFQTNSEPTPSAEYITRSEMFVIVKNITNHIQHVTDGILFAPQCIRSLVYIAYHSGCRINELLALKKNDLDANNSLCIKASKGSNDRSVIIPENNCLDWFRNSPDNLPFSIYSSSFVYRELKKLHFDNYFYVNAHNAVTHIFRYVYAYRFYLLSENYNAVQQALGHKDIKSTMQYFKPL